MTRCFYCGQYICRIDGSNKLLSLIPNSWDKYEQAEGIPSRTVMIRMEEENLGYEAAGSDKWFLRERQGSPMAVYFRNGKELLGLQYIDPYVVSVFIRKAVDSYIRIGIHYGLMLALHQECIGMHGVTVLCGNEIVILSAPSGTGKTTLGKLLERFCDAVMINGDFALLDPTDDGVFYEPTPFCGSSGRALNHRFRVNRVVFLYQAEKNEWRELSGREAMTQFMNNSFIPSWDCGMQKTIQESILKSISMLKVNAFGFIPTQGAAEMFLKQVKENS